jgi:branched-chain amino acid transport system ATP-binding protein
VTPALEVRGLARHFGGFVALRDVSFSVRVGTTHAIIGPNGAGKSTLVNTISGLLAPTAGSVWLAGADISHRRAHQIARMGLVRTFQIASLFADLTVRENLDVALVACRRYRPGAHRRSSDELLELFGLGAAAHQRVAWLSHGDQRILEVALALAADPQVMLLDEPTAGMSPDETDRFIRLVNDRLKGNHTVVLIEHDMDVVSQTTDHVTVLCAGAVLADGAREAVMVDALVQEAYLGRAEH